MTIVTTVLGRQMDTGSTYKVTARPFGANEGTTLVGQLEPLVAAEVLDALRLVYNYGRADQKMETSLLFRGLISL